MSWRRFIGLERSPAERWDRMSMQERVNVAFSVFGIDNLPPEMREGMTEGGQLALRVSRALALQVPAVLRSRNLICGTLATLPVHLRNPQREVVERSVAPTTLFDQINPDVPDVVTYAETYEDLLFEGISWWRVLERNFAGWPTFAERIDPRSVHVSVEGRIYVNGYEVRDADVIRFDSPNPPLLVHGARAIRTCLALDMAANSYANWPVPLGYLTPKADRRVNEDEQAIEDLLDRWEEGARRRVWRYIPSALEAKSLQFNAEQIQLADQRQHAVLEIARVAGVDPEDLGVSTTSRTYQNSEQRRQDLLDFTMAAYRSAVEQRLSMRDIVPRGYRAKVNLDGFLRGDTKTRMETYAVGKPLGIYPDERLAELEDIPRVEPQEPRENPQNTSSIPDNERRRLEVVE
jgi:hypothetical protein